MHIPKFRSTLPLPLTSGSLFPSTSQVKSYSSGEHEGSAQRKPQGPARWGRVVGMHTAAPAALWAAWDEFTCAGTALLEAFLSELRVLASLFARLAGVRGVRAHEEEADWALVLVRDG